MRSIKLTLVQGLLVATAAMSLLMGCHSKPSDSDVEQALRAEFKTASAISWVGTVFDTKDLEISTIEIKQWGSYNGDEGYWPLKVRVAGSVKQNFVSFDTGKKTVKKFDHTGDFKLHKDDYGNWKATLVGRR